MIIEGLFNLVFNFLGVILTPFQIIPDMPQHFVNIGNKLMAFLLDAVGFLFYFVSPSSVKVAIPLVILICNMEHIWDGIIWILKKLPFVGIE